MHGRRVWRLRHGVWAGVVALAGMVCVFVVGIQPAASQPNDIVKKVRICHATSAEKNPYVSNEPAIANNGDLHGGHLDHTGPVFPAADWGDIIPPYEYVDANGVTQIFPGYNWTPRGQAIWQNGCEAAPESARTDARVRRRRAGRRVPGALRLPEPETPTPWSCRSRTRSFPTRRIEASRRCFSRAG